MRKPRDKAIVKRLARALQALLPVFALLAGCAQPPLDPAQRRADETALVRATVADPARAETLLGLIDERERLIGETREMLRQYRREMRAINADYGAGRDVVVDMIDDYNRDRALKQLAFIDLVTKMKAATSAAEWAVIADFQLRNANPRKLLYRPLEDG